jgi:hypothetical protein
MQAFLHGYWAQVEADRRSGGARQRGTAGSEVAEETTKTSSLVCCSGSRVDLKSSVSHSNAKMNSVSLLPFAGWATTAGHCQEVGDRHHAGLWRLIRVILEQNDGSLEPQYRPPPPRRTLP